MKKPNKPIGNNEMEAYKEMAAFYMEQCRRWEELHFRFTDSFPAKRPKSRDKIPLHLVSGGYPILN